MCSTAGRYLIYPRLPFLVIREILHFLEKQITPLVALGFLVSIQDIVLRWAL